MTAGKRPYARRMFATVSSSARRLSGPNRVVTSPTHRISHVFAPRTPRATRSATRAGDETKGSSASSSSSFSYTSSSSPATPFFFFFFSISRVVASYGAVGVDADVRDSYSRPLLDPVRDAVEHLELRLERHRGVRPVPVPPHVPELDLLAPQQWRSTRGTAMFGRFTMVCVTNPSAPSSETRESSRAPTSPSWYRTYSGSSFRIMYSSAVHGRCTTMQYFTIAAPHREKARDRPGSVERF